MLPADRRQCQCRAVTTGATMTDRVDVARRTRAGRARRRRQRRSRPETTRAGKRPSAPYPRISPMDRHLTPRSRSEPIIEEPRGRNDVPVHGSPVRTRNVRPQCRGADERREEDDDAGARGSSSREKSRPTVVATTCGPGARSQAPRRGHSASRRHVRQARRRPARATHRRAGRRSRCGPDACRGTPATR